MPPYLLATTATTITTAVTAKTKMQITAGGVDSVFPSEEGVFLGPNILPLPMQPPPPAEL
jgi:hypothetical protein